MAEENTETDQQPELADGADDGDFRRWYDAAEATFESGELSSEHDGTEEGSYGDYINSLRNDSAGLPSIYRTEDEDGSDKTGDSELPYNSEFYKQPEQLQLAIYASDVVTLQDKNLLLTKQLDRVKTAHMKYRKESERKGYEIDRLSAERDKAIGEKYRLVTKVEYFEQQLAKLKEDLQSERELRLKACDAKPDAKTEQQLLDAKYKLAKYAEQNDDLEFQMNQVLEENKALRDRTMTQEEQLHNLSTIVSRAGVKLSSLDRTFVAKFGPEPSSLNKPPMTPDQRATNSADVSFNAHVAV